MFGRKFAQKFKNKATDIRDGIAFSGEDAVGNGKLTILLWTYGETELYPKAFII